MIEAKCNCGKVHLQLPTVAPHMGTHIVCYCKDCRAFNKHLNKDDFILEHGGCGVFQTRPDWVCITAGAGHLRALKVRPKGLMRWYAACCNTPMAVTAAKPKLPFIGIMAGAVADKASLGPVLVRGFTAFAINPPPSLKDRGMPTLIARFAKRSLASYMTGEFRKNPFFDDDAVDTTPHVLTVNEYQAARQ